MKWFLVPALLVVAAIGYVLWGVFKVLVIDIRDYAEYWKQQAARPVQSGDIRVVALGDSTFQAIGASRPELGTVGRIASYLEEETGRSVHVTNLSVSGAKVAEVVDNQLPQTDFSEVDLVIVAIGANDVNRSSDVGEFEENINKLASSLPAERTIMADVAMIKNRDSYQAALAEARHKYGIMAANLRDGFSDVKYPWRLSGRDFFHPSDYGYSFWFAGFKPAVDTMIDRHQLAK